MLAKKKMMQALAVRRGVGGVVLPEAIDFDGTNDYLSRGSDLTGNADGKTFTVSFWVYSDQITEGNDQAIIGNSSDRFYIFGTSGNFQVVGNNSSGTQIFSVSPGTSNALPGDTWNHVVISIDLTNSSNRHFYINDEIVSSPSWSTYTNDDIDFTTSDWFVGQAGGAKRDERLSHVYLDYTYRDLSMEANRRLFITADGKPASGQSSLSPILYVPMDDPTQPGRNDGTGGDFALTGTVARSGRGPNQYNPVASMLETGDSLSLSSFSGPVSTGYTVSGIVKSDLANQTLWFWTDHGSVGVDLQAGMLNTGQLRMYAYDRDTATTLINITADDLLVSDRYYSIQMIFDPVTEAGNEIWVDGVKQTTTTNTFVSRTSHDISNVAKCGSGSAGQSFSEVYLADEKIDLSTTNPFFDTETGKAKYLGANGELPTGTAPLIYLPLRANDAGNNLGTGGDFTVNSGPFVGARGPNEFWARCAEFNGTSQFLSGTTALNGAVNTGTFAFAFFVNVDTISVNNYVARLNSSNTTINVIINATSGSIGINGYNAAGGSIFNAVTASGAITAGTNSLVLISVDLSDTGKRCIYVNNVAQSVTWSTYVNDSFGWDTSIAQYIGAYNGVPVYPLDGKIGFLWFDTSYIDFSQEANRLKFFDAFGYPADLGADGSTPTGAAPRIYLNNDFHLGGNLGTGGDFTPQNTPTDGGFVKG